MNFTWRYIPIIEDDDVFEEERAKGLNMPTEGHVREAVFTKAIESAINPLAYGIQIPNMGELQSGKMLDHSHNISTKTGIE